MLILFPNGFQLDNRHLAHRNPKATAGYAALAV